MLAISIYIIQTNFFSWNTLNVQFFYGQLIQNLLNYPSISVNVSISDFCSCSCQYISIGRTHCIKFVNILSFISSCFIITSSTTPNKVAERGVSLFDSRFHSKLFCIFIIYLNSCSSIGVNQISLTKCAGNLCSAKNSIILFIYTQSKAYVQSTNILCRSILCSYHFSKICLILNILSIADLYG